MRDMSRDSDNDSVVKEVVEEEDEVASRRGIEIIRKELKYYSILSLPAVSLASCTAHVDVGESGVS
jgi:hypothetical protein